MTLELVYETHSISVDNEHGIATGWLPGELSARGRQLARELGERRRTDGLACVVTSDLRRAVETTAIAFEGSGLEIRQDARLRECDYGSLNGAPVDRIEPRRRYVDEPYPGGESWRVCAERMRDVLDDLVREFDGRRVLVVAHSAQRFALRHLLCREPLEEVVDAPFAWQEGWEYVVELPTSRGTVERAEGRVLFGRDPAAYDRARPGYPERVFDVLRDGCGLRPGTAVLELGPGPGTATRRLLELGARPLVAIEPNASSAAYLGEVTRGAVEILVEPLEDVELPRSFDLVVAATSFHWIDPDRGLPKVRDALVRDGWLAMWSNIHGDLAGDDPFHLATAELLGPSPEAPWPRFTDEEANARLLAAFGFVDVEYELVRSSRRFDPAGIRALYATFSNIERRPPDEREAVLDGLERIAADEFGGVVERAILTTLYTARRP